MSLVELLRARSSEYELLAGWPAERAPLDDEHSVACQAMAVVGDRAQEVAEAIDAEWAEAVRGDGPRGGGEVMFRLKRKRSAKGPRFGANLR